MLVFVDVGFLDRCCSRWPLLRSVGVGSWTLGVELLVCALLANVVSPACCAGWYGACGSLDPWI